MFKTITDELAEMDEACEKRAKNLIEGYNKYVALCEALKDFEPHKPKKKPFEDELNKLQTNTYSENLFYKKELKNGIRNRTHR